MHAPRKHRRRIAAITAAAAATAALSLVSAAVFLGTPLDATGAGAGTGGRVAVEAPAGLTVDGVSGPGSPAGTGRGETFGMPLP
ncbi:hypothetical protein [Streptomyces sp. NPDC058613]|uniref:hypothetical protein n=1 Tax=unclassified Streptomyces TaxID=2593676 RepID=UPI003655AF90